jgi:hypothetical protein
MTVDGLTPTEGRFTRAWRSFRRWRKHRPFWGGLLLILAGLELLYSGNLNLGSIQVHLGLIGFKSYIIPLVVILCGALAWATPAQRLFYGIIGTAAVVYSIVSVNLGGFLIGLLLGMFGGALTIAWVPNKRGFLGAPRGESHVDVDPAASEPDDVAPGAGDGTDAHDATADPGAPIPAQPTHDDPAWARPAGDDPKPEGEQRQPFRRHRHPVDDVTDRNSGDGGRRALAITIVALSLAASVTIAVRYSSPAAADTCTPTPLQSAISKALGIAAGSTASKTTASSAGAGNATATKAAVTSAAGGRGSAASVGTVGASTTGGTSTSGRTSTSGATVAATGSTPSPAPRPLVSLIGGVGGVVGDLLGAASTPPSTPASDPPSSPPPPAPTPSPTPTPTPSPGPTPTHTVAPSPSPSPTSTGSPPPSTSTATPSASSPPPCSVTAKQLAAAPGQPPVNVVPSTQKAAMLTMSGLSYDGNVELPTATGTILAMQFSMTSSTSTPFELDVRVGDHTIVITSPSLTVSGDVKFYATEIKGNLEGITTVDFTPSSPPPLTVPDLFFTDATISLAFVTSSTLTAGKLVISPT